MTYSIVARDAETGQLGVAVQSRWFSVGRIAPWAEAGVGAVATQSFAEPAYGPRGLDLMRSGLAAPDALRALLAVDSGEALRQVAMVDASGTVAAHTGSACVAESGHRLGDGYSVQANMMERATVWDRMAEAFEDSSGELVDRLLAALDAAEAEGGDIRGRQSAALLVVAGERTGDPERDVVHDLRVDDAPEPLAELRRLLDVQRAYESVSRGLTLAREGDLDAASLEAVFAAEALPGDDQLAFFAGLVLASAGRMEEAQPLLERAGRANARWADFPARLAAAGAIPRDSVVLEAVTAVLKERGGPKPNRL